ncbi:isochorismate synthase [Haloprofundus marisrubri]|uniref:isochorismate synthase n=1 Tax=Haloprofundus marisrubri TaxID=1514971 RepID=A0A0W1RC96_9EURY|nr:isochorismate synthase [Haloprofundus marisrubri]KTG10243.1 isochorismate synthase [Haloprofundus marisrubri]
MNPAQRNQEAVVSHAEATLVSRSCEIPDVSFRAFLADQNAPRVHWASPDGLELVGGGAAAHLTASGPKRFDSLRDEAEALFADADHEGPEATRPRMLGGLSFDADHEETPPWTGFAAATFVLPRVQLTRGDDATWLTVVEYGPDATVDSAADALDAARESLSELPMMRPSGGSPGVADRHWRTPKREWTAQVERVTERIRSGDLLKVVLATALDLELAEEVDIPDVLERLRRTYPECYRFLVQPTDEAAFFGPPPERLVKRAGRSVETEALAGSMPRGETPEDDADYAESLLESEKLQHEQQLVADTICEQLEQFGDVTARDKRIRKLSNIQHLQTPISATLDGDAHVLSLVEALHPTPAVGGLPLEAALETIRETESFDRGWYASPVGWFDADGNGEFAVGIRSGVAGGKQATLFAGNGIVGDSDPEAEWDELQPKVRPILDELE